MAKTFFREGFYRELKNLEAAECYTTVMRVLNEFPIEKGYVRECVEQLQAYRNEIRYVKDLNAPHPLTEVLQQKTVQRKESLLAFRSKLFASTKSLIEQEQRAGQLLMGWLRFNFGQKLYQPSFTHHSNSVRNMMHDLSLRPDLREAVRITGTQSAIDVVVQISQEIDEGLDQRTRQQVARKKKAAQIRAEVYQLLKKLFRVLEVEMLMHPEENGLCVELSYRLKKVLEYYRTPYVARTTRYRNAVLKTEAETSPEESVPIEDVQAQVEPKEAKAMPIEAASSEKRQVAPALCTTTIEQRETSKATVLHSPTEDALEHAPQNTASAVPKERQLLASRRAIKKRLKVRA